MNTFLLLHDNLDDLLQGKTATEYIREVNPFGLTPHGRTVLVVLLRRAVKEQEARRNLYDLLDLSGATLGHIRSLGAPCRTVRTVPLPWFNTDTWREIMVLWATVPRTELIDFLLETLEKK